LQRKARAAGNAQAYKTDRKAHLIINNLQLCHYAARQSRIIHGGYASVRLPRCLMT